ncbi:MAG: AAA family ATPase, partial [Acidimicrobiales bacterium]
MAVRPRRRTATPPRDPDDKARLVALVEADRDVLGLLAEPLAGFDTLAYSDLDELVESEIYHRSALIMVLGPSQMEGERLERCGKMIQARSGLGAVLVVDRLTTDSLRMALRAGIDDAVSMEAVNTELEPIVREVSMRLAHAVLTTEEPPPTVFVPASRPGRITTVFSPKGGVGTSVVAVNLAAALAQESKTPVVLVDLDLQFGDVAVMLRMQPNANILDVAEAGSRADAPMVRNLLTLDETTKVLVLPAPPEPTLAGGIDGAAISILFAALRELGAQVVVDSATGLSDFILSALSDSDDIVFVLGMDIPSVKNAKLGLQAFELLEIPLD